YVTPAEHLGLPAEEDVRVGVMAARIAAHAADIAKGVKGAWDWDLKMARARASLDREAVAGLAIDPALVRCYLEKEKGEPCSACGDECALRLVSEYFQQ
ncbi:phosphomethylpyrimidine synthase ThiC, partial [Desulfofundulus sp.]|uniref:phosphomethylpyrimidine synthase ThiC n=1 Tax=Desulfofundulus sp. TaxID=2282750 RepID=UPI003C78EA23